jgi:type IV secretory pathway VirB10-like protein
MKNPFHSLVLFYRGLAHFGGLSKADGKEQATTRGVPARARRAEVPDVPKPPAAPSPPPAPPRRLTAPMLPNEDPYEEMRGDSPAARARCGERARCAAIVTSTAGLKQAALAYALAFHSTLSEAEAVALLEGTARSQWAHLNGMKVTCIEGKWVQSNVMNWARGASRYRPANVN